MHQPDPIWIFLDPLESKGFEYFVTGSVASIFYGDPRLTHDIDLVLHLELEENGLMEFWLKLTKD